MHIAYHGNWCGPGWSDGRRVSSTRGFAPAIDEFDESCRQHDFALSGGGRDDDADMAFVRQNLFSGPKRSLAALAVLSRNLVDRLSADNNSKETMTKPALRGSNAATKATVSKNRSHNTVAAPVSIGTVMRSVKTKHVQTKDGSILHGSDFISPVEGEGVSTFGVGKSALLSPAYFLGTFLGNLARSYEKYRWRKLRIHYVPKVSTATSGQIVLCSSHSASEPCLQGEAGTFLQRAMSQGNASLGPLWMENFIDIDCRNNWLMVDPLSASDLDDAIAEELQVYVQTQVSGQVGYLYAEYEVEFSQLTFQQHSTSIPISTGPGIRVTLTDALAVNATNDDWALSDPAGSLAFATVANGAIFRAVFDIQGSTAYTGGTFATGFRIGCYYHSTTSTTSPITTTYPIIGGTTIYLAVLGSTVVAYSSLEAAINGNGTGQIFLTNASTVAGSYNFDVALVRIGAALISAVQ